MATAYQPRYRPSFFGGGVTEFLGGAKCVHNRGWALVFAVRPLFCVHTFSFIPGGEEEEGEL